MAFNGTKFGVFSLSQQPDQATRVEAFDGDFRQFELAEELGYDTVWLAEHLFSTYGVVTSTQVLAAAVAERTKTIDIGMAIVVIPFNHPLRTASDFALVDVLSHGRLKFGVGRAYQPHEFAGLDIPMDQSREMFTEGMEIITKAWTKEKMSYFGRHWRVPIETEVLPKPVQQPHPPIYQASISPESYEVAARNGWHLQLASPFNYRTYRERWMDELEVHLADFEKRRAHYGHPPGEERMLLTPFFVAESNEEAIEIYKPRVEWFYAKVSANQAGLPGQGDVVKGYELGMSEGKKTREMGYLTFDKLREHGACVVGDPDYCVERLREMKRRFGITEFTLWFNMAGIDGEVAERSMRLAMDKVLPRV